MNTGEENNSLLAKNEALQLSQVELEKSVLDINKFKEVYCMIVCSGTCTLTLLLLLLQLLKYTTIELLQHSFFVEMYTTAAAAFTIL